MILPSSKANFTGYCPNREKLHASRTHPDAERAAELDTLRSLVGDDTVMQDATDALVQGALATPDGTEDPTALAFEAGRQEGYADGYADGYTDAQAGRPRKDVR
jgi:hypothetical protein